MKLGELQKTIDWLKEYINRMKDREDYEELKTNIAALEKAVRELEEKVEQWTNGTPL